MGLRRCSEWVRFGAALALLPVVLVQQGAAWGSDGHRMINRLAIEKLPESVPAFLRTRETLDAMEYLGPEPDRWRSLAEPELSATTAPDHFMDMEYAELVSQNLSGHMLPRKRYDFLRALAVAQKAHPDLDLTPEKVGMLPYAAEEGYEHLKNAMREYRNALAAKGNLQPLEHEIVYLAGTLGHYVADASQPLHATLNYNGWAGDNPNHYTTDKTIHAAFETDFVKANVQATRDLAPLVPAKAEVVDDVFAQFSAFLHESNAQVEPLYQLEKQGAFAGAGTPAGNAFVKERMAAGATELRNLIYTAWMHSADPVPEYRNSAPVKQVGL